MSSAPSGAAEALPSAGEAYSIKRHGVTITGKHLELELTETDLVELVRCLAGQHEHTAPRHQIDVCTTTDPVLLPTEVPLPLDGSDPLRIATSGLSRPTVPSGQ